MFESDVATSCARRAVLMDRDGTLIEDLGYLNDPERVRLLPGLAPALRRLCAAGFGLVVVSNQSGLWRRRITLEQHFAVHAALIETLRRERIELNGAFYCPHGPEQGCVCRKPMPGLLLRAAERLSLSLPECWMVGDRASDLDAARSAGCKPMRADKFLGAISAMVAS